MANIGVICGAPDTISIVFNFIALAIIAEFDNFVYGSLKNESFKELTERKFAQYALVICHTTSKKCKDEEVTKELDKEDEPRPLKIKFMNRTLGNKILFSVYKFLRTFYVSLFYYFIPFSSVIISTLMPVLNRSYYTYNLPSCP